jgi:hypothetical protein
VERVLLWKDLYPRNKIIFLCVQCSRICSHWRKEESQLQFICSMDQSQTVHAQISSAW